MAPIGASFPSTWALRGHHLGPKWAPLGYIWAICGPHAICAPIWDQPRPYISPNHRLSSPVCACHHMSSRYRVSSMITCSRTSTCHNVFTWQIIMLTCMHMRDHACLYVHLRAYTLHLWLLTRHPTPMPLRTFQNRLPTRPTS